MILHAGFSKDIRTGELLDNDWHHWTSLNAGLERVCDGKGEADGIGPTTFIHPRQPGICEDCSHMLLDDLMQEKSARFEYAPQEATR